MDWIGNIFGKRLREQEGFGATSSRASSPQFPTPEKRKKAAVARPQLREINEYVFEVCKPTKNPASVEVVFVHGFKLEGSDDAHISTWMSRDGCELWLEWIRKDFSDARILTVSYDAHGRQTHNQGRTDMYITRENILQSLIGSEAQVGQSGCPVVLVGHCLGGVVIKELCLQADLQVRSRKVLDKFNQRSKHFLDNLKGLFYYGTPHHGASFAGIKTWFAKGPLLDLMTILNNEAARRGEEFRALGKAYGWFASAVAEGLETIHGTFKGMMVEEASARSGVGSFYTDRSADHFNVCKAESITSCTFLRLTEFLALVLNKEKVQLLAPSLLPFVAVDKYVPIDGSVSAVMKALARALEDERRVIVWGSPGTGKTSLLKYLALLYENQRRSPSAESSSNTIQFPDGVVYLNCGRNAEGRLTNLQQDLLQQLQSLRLVAGARMHEMEFFTPESFRSKLMTSLGDKELLFVLDDVWEQTVAEQFLVPNGGVRYLIASQFKCCIHMEAKAIPAALPSKEEARKILANFTKGLPIKGEFPPTLQEEVDAITYKLQYHALSIANVGISVPSSEAAASSRWESIRENLYDHLELGDDLQKPSLYEAHYSFAMSASMTMMLDSLKDEHRELLYLIALIIRDGYQLKSLVKYFYGFVQRNSATFKYQRLEKLLEDRSLIEIRPDSNSIRTHDLRVHYIRKENRRAVGCIASRIVHVSTDEGTIKRIRSGDAEETLVTILSTEHFHKSFASVAASSLATHIKILNDEVIPPSLNDGNDVLDAVKSGRSQWELLELFSLVNTEAGDGDWRQQAREYAKKIIIRWVCQRKLDDGSMGGLIEMKQTGTNACCALSRLYNPPWTLVGDIVGALSADKETLRALRSVLSDSTTPGPTLESAKTLFADLLSGSTDAILWVPKMWMELLAMDDAHPDLPIFMANVLMRHTPPTPRAITVAEFPGLLEALFAIWFSETGSGSGRDCTLLDTLGRSLIFLCSWMPLALRIAAIPSILRVLFSLFVSEGRDRHIGSVAGAILYTLICIPEKRIEFSQIEGGLEGLADIVAKMKGVWEVTDEEMHREGLGKRASLAARILGELALEEELRETIGRLPGLQEGLLFLQLLELATLLRDVACSTCSTECDSNDPKWYSALNSTKALTILYSDCADPRATEVPALGQVLEVFPSYSAKPSEHTVVSVQHLYASIYMIRGTALIEMGAYEGALMNIDRAHHCLQQIQSKQQDEAERCGFRHLALYTSYLHEIQLLKRAHANSRQVSLCFRTSPLVLSSFVSGQTYHPCRTQRPMQSLRDCQIFLQTMLKKYDVALQGANQRLERVAREPWDEHPFVWDSRPIWDSFSGLIEKGVLKRLSNDWLGALDDFNQAMKFGPEYNNDSAILHVECEDEYDAFKHRGYVKYLLGDEVGSRTDAEFALKVKFNELRREPVSAFERAKPWVQATKDYTSLWRLSRLPVAYLGYHL